ncbi:MAG: IS110 family transposase [Thermoanaerobaculia bacterium]
MSESTTIAVDLAKSIFELAVSPRPGHVSTRHRLNRAELLRFFAQRSPATVLFEACGSSHFWAREIEAFGHRVVLLPPQHVRRYRPRNKTDRADAKALLEAFRNEEIRPVPVKSPAQQQLAALHRLRSAWLGTRTARINTLRGLLREQGIVIPVGARHVVPRALELAGEDESGLSDGLRFALFELAREIRECERRLSDLEKRLAALAREDALAVRLRTVPGVGLITATALAGFGGDLRRFSSGRRFASYLGLTPRERSSGSIRRLGAISKRGDTYLRMLLIHGARAVLAAAPQMKEPDRLRSWALALAARIGHNKATVALANKLARYAWAVATREVTFNLEVGMAA